MCVSVYKRLLLIDTFHKIEGKNNESNLATLPAARTHAHTGRQKRTLKVVSECPEEVCILHCVMSKRLYEVQLRACGM